MVPQETGEVVGATYPLDSCHRLTDTTPPPTQSSCELSHTKEENSINLCLMRMTKGTAEMEKLNAIQAVAVCAMVASTQRNSSMAARSRVSLQKTHRMNLFSL